MIKTVRGWLFTTLFLFSFLIIISWFLNYTLIKNHEYDEHVIDLLIRKITLVNQVAFESGRSQATSLESETRAFEEVLQLLENGGEYTEADGSVIRYEPSSNMKNQVAQLRSDWEGFLRSLSALRETPAGSPAYAAAEADLLVKTNQIDITIFRILSSLEQFSHQRHSLLQGINFGLILIALITLVLSLYYVNIRITEPIRGLTASVQQFSRGVVGPPVSRRANDEIAILGSAFESMRSEIISHQTNLEEKIAHRIHELTTAFEISQDIVVQQDLNVLLDAARMRIQKLMKTNKVSICLLDPRAIGISGQDHSERPLPDVSADWLNIIEAPRLGEKDVLLNDVFQCNCDLMTAVPGRVHVTPLRVGNDLIGEICIVREERADLGANEKRAFKLVANAIAVAIQNARLTDQLRRKAYETAKINERKRVASDLHDNLAQTLNVLYMQTEALGEELPQSTTEKIPQQMADIRSNLATAMEQVRLAISGSDDLLRQTKRDLAGELQGYLEAYRAEASIDVVFNDPDEIFERFDELVQKQIIYIIREALTNIWKHANASKIGIALALDGQYGSLTIQDDGKGFDTRAPQGDHHLGLRVMKARAERTQGSLEIQSMPGQGTVISATFPMTEVMTDL